MELQLLNAVLLGIIEGLTEFIPVSSTGHLIVLSDLLGAKGEKISIFDIVIQLGAILAVVVIYRRLFLGLVCPKFARQEGGTFLGVAGLLRLFVATVPAGIAGLIFYDKIKAIFDKPLWVVVALIVGGVLLIVVEKTKKNVTVNRLEDISLLQCFLVGCFQCLALWPGMSRSGSTIIGARFLNFEKKVAAQFSFIIAVPLMVVAVGYELYKNYAILSLDDIPLFCVGFFVSFITALLAIKFFLAILKKYSLVAFGWYRIIFGIIFSILYL